MVCLGNICRSPLAHGILESKLSSDKFYVDSAGTNNYHTGQHPDKRSIKVARENGIDISDQICRQFQLSDFDTYDQIYVMDLANLETVMKLARNSEDRSKVKLISNHRNDQSTVEIPDPYFGGSEGFENVYKILNAICDTLSEDLQK